MEFFNETDCDIEYRTFPDGVNEKWNSGFSIAKANRILRECGCRMFGKDVSMGWTPWQDPSDTMSALLLCVEPIEKDSAEKILRDFIHTGQTPNIWMREDLERTLKKLYDRARALLEKGEG